MEQFDWYLGGGDDRAVLVAELDKAGVRSHYYHIYFFLLDVVSCRSYYG